MDVGIKNKEKLRKLKAKYDESEGDNLSFKEVISLLLVEAGYTDENLNVDTETASEEKRLGATKKTTKGKSRLKVTWKSKTPEKKTPVKKPAAADLVEGGIAKAMKGATGKRRKRTKA